MNNANDKFECIDAECDETCGAHFCRIKIGKNKVSINIKYILYNF